MRDRADGGHQGNAAFKTQQDQCAYECTETVASRTGPAQVCTRWGPASRGEVDTSPIPLTQQLSLIDNHSERKKLVFSNFVSLRIRITLHHRPRAQRRCQHKMNSRASLEVLCLGLLCWGLFFPVYIMLRVVWLLCDF